jgi:hypothetical protein
MAKLKTQMSTERDETVYEHNAVTKVTRESQTEQELTVLTVEEQYPESERDSPEVLDVKPEIDIDGIVKQAVDTAIANVEERHCEELEALHIKVQDLISKKNGDINRSNESLIFYKTKVLELEAMLKNLAQ